MEGEGNIQDQGCTDIKKINRILSAGYRELLGINKGMMKVFCSGFGVLKE